MPHPAPADAVPHHEYVLEVVYWDAGTARLLPRLIKGRVRGPVSSPATAPAPAKPSTTATSAPTPDGTVHEIRHSGLTYLGEAGASLLELIAESRHRKPDNLRHYFKPSPAAMRGVTSLLGPDHTRR